MAEEKREKDKYFAQWQRKSGKRQIFRSMGRKSGKEKSPSLSLLPQSSSSIFRDNLNPASQPKIPDFPL
jgi:hypothetical protein